MLDIFVIFLHFVGIIIATEENGIPIVFTSNLVIYVICLNLAFIFYDFVIF